MSGKINSRSKGARFERELAAWLRDTYGISDARRGQQFAGGSESPDVIGWRGVHIEAKHVERLNLEDAMIQSERDAAGKAVPVVIHKRNRTAIMLTVRLDQIEALAVAIAGLRGRPIYPRDADISPGESK